MRPLRLCPARLHACFRHHLSCAWCRTPVHAVAGGMHRDHVHHLHQALRIDHDLCDSSSTLEARRSRKCLHSPMPWAVYLCLQCLCQPLPIKPTATSDKLEC
jgi:hypothetical protein